MSFLFAQVAVPTPLRRLFTYKNILGLTEEQIGCRVRVPFGRRELIGIVTGVSNESSTPENKLKPVTELLDEQPVWPTDLWQMLNWSAQYYQHPLGDVFAAALPGILRQGKPAAYPEQIFWSLKTQHDKDLANSLKRAPKQLAVIKSLQEAGGTLEEQVIMQRVPSCRDALNRLQQKQLLLAKQVNQFVPAEVSANIAGPDLNPEQLKALEVISSHSDEYRALLLEGVTGSGKTEVYLQAIEKVLTKDKQCLVLIPEIGLTPQMIQRFTSRLSCAVGVLHSGLSDNERLITWLAARDGHYGVILGTRSAIFTPLPDPGLIIIDEEHDASFKQQDGFRYSARDMAIWRAHHGNFPIILGSATPSLESIENASRDRFSLIELRQRAGNAEPPIMHLLDMRSQPAQEGLSDRLIQLMEQHLQRDQQVLLFLNRRGFSPTLMCHDCGWIASCSRCESNMTYHHLDRRLRCHHCGSERRADTHCQSCQSKELLTIGAGTERIETHLKEIFADTEIIRIDRDTTRRKGSLQALIDKVRAGRRQILIGTQMLAKGHHFPNVTMVGIVDADQGLHSPEFRAPERMAQLILQVAGRAGRAEQPGEVYIQTHHPDHPLLLSLINEGYDSFARSLLAERREAALPPYTTMALFRAEATSRAAPLEFLQQVKDLLSPQCNNKIQLLGPLPSPMEKRAGRYRAQLLVNAVQRPELQKLLKETVWRIDELKTGKVRWSLDVDPIDTY